MAELQNYKTMNPPKRVKGIWRILTYAIIIGGLIIAGIAINNQQNARLYWKNHFHGGWGTDSIHGLEIRLEYSNIPFKVIMERHWTENGSSFETRYIPINSSTETEIKFRLYLSIGIWNNDTVLNLTEFKLDFSSWSNIQIIKDVELTWDPETNVYAAEINLDEQDMEADKMELLFTFNSTQITSPKMSIFPIYDENQAYRTNFIQVLLVLGGIGIIGWELFQTYLIPYVRISRHNKTLIQIIQKNDRVVYDHALEELQRDHAQFIEDLQNYQLKDKGE